MHPFMSPVTHDVDISEELCARAQTLPRCCEKSTKSAEYVGSELDGEIFEATIVGTATEF